VGQSQDLVDRCLTLLKQGQFPEADRLARQGVQEFPESGGLWQVHGLLRQSAGDIDGACFALETASLLVPLTSAAQCALADCHAKAGRRDLARQLYQALARSQRCPTDLLPAVASGLGTVGDPETALEVCRELARREPTSHEALFGMVYYMRRLGRPLDAVLPIMIRAHELAPDSPVYRIVLASLLAQDGRRDEAYDLLRNVRPDAVHCSCCARRVVALFQQVGDVERAEAFRTRFDPANKPRLGEP
jgi:tetratricopeptide (TPR) repeat protein